MFKEKLHILDIHSQDGNIIGTGLDCTCVSCAWNETPHETRVNRFSFSLFLLLPPCGSIFVIGTSQTAGKVWTHLHGLLNTLTQAKRGKGRWEARGEEAQKNTGGATDIRRRGRKRRRRFTMVSRDAFYSFSGWILTAASRRFDPRSLSLCRLRSLLCPEGPIAALSLECLHVKLNSSHIYVSAFTHSVQHSLIMGTAVGSTRGLAVPQPVTRTLKGRFLRIDLMELFICHACITAVLQPNHVTELMCNWTRRAAHWLAKNNNSKNL